MAIVRPLIGLNQQIKSTACWCWVYRLENLAFKRHSLYSNP